MRIYENGKYRDMTSQEVIEMEKQASLAAIAERTRSLTESEVTRMIIAQQINTLAVDNNTALRMKNFYPEWTANVAYAAGFKVLYNGRLWSVLQAHTSQVGWEPETAASLWTEICESHTGTNDDPIPYGGNMALENGKYYIQENEIYLCIRDTVNPVHHTLSELIGMYVEVA